MKRMFFVVAAAALLLAGCDLPTDPSKGSGQTPPLVVPSTVSDSPGPAPGFGSGGVVTVGSSGKQTFIHRAVVDSSHRIVAVQYEMTQPGPGSVAPPTTKLVRFTEAGKLDTSFGSGGYFEPPTVASTATALSVTTSGSPTVEYWDTAVDADGSAYLSGSLYSESGGANQFTAFLVKVTSTGNLDTSFGTNGYVNLGYAQSATVHSLASGVVVSFMATTNLGTIVEKVSAAGAVGSPCTVEGIPSGQTANNQSPGGGQNGDYSSFPDSLLSPDGNSLYVPAYLVTTSGGTLTRTLKVAKVDLTSTPTLDSSYGTSGYASTVVTPPAGYLFSIHGTQVVDGDGNVILLMRTRAQAQGASQGSAGFQLLRFQADGTYDTNFDATFHYPTGDASPYNGILAGNKLVLGGSYRATGSTSRSGCLLRFDLTTGVQDTNYGTGGILKPLSSLNAPSSFIMDLILDRGSILAIGNIMSAAAAGSMPSMTTVMVRLQ